MQKCSFLSCSIYTYNFGLVIRKNNEILLKLEVIGGKNSNLICVAFRNVLKSKTFVS